MTSNQFRRGDIWLVDFNPTKGREQSGVRPSLIISDDDFNNSKNELVIAIPLTSKKHYFPSHIEINPPEGGIKVTSYLRCEDIKSISHDRIIEKWGTIQQSTLQAVEKVVKIILGI